MQNEYSLDQKLEFISGQCTHNWDSFLLFAFNIYFQPFFIRRSRGSTAASLRDGFCNMSLFQTNSTRYSKPRHFPAAAFVFDKFGALQMQRAQLCVFHFHLPFNFPRALSLFLSFHSFFFSLATLLYSTLAPRTYLRLLRRPNPTRPGASLKLDRARCRT